jgi:hypothetical protein
MYRVWCCLALFALAFIATPLAAQTDSVEQDAQEYTRLAMRHDQLLLKLNMKRISDAELGEMDRLKANGEQIKAKYAAGRVSAPIAAAFAKRLKELSDEIIAPARKGWVVDAFPEPTAVAAAISDELRRAAAMRVLTRMLAEKVQPPIPASAAKIERYQAAWMNINPKSRADYAARLDTIDSLSWNKQFTFDVLNMFVPVYAVEAGNVLRKDRYETGMAEAKAQVWSASLTVVLTILALPLFYLWRGEGRARKSRSSGGEVQPFQLPAALERVNVWRKSYALDFVCGRLSDKIDKTVTVNEREYRDTDSIRTGDGMKYYSVTPTFRDVTYTKTLYCEYHLEHPDGHTATLYFPRDPGHAAVGQIYSALCGGSNILLCHDHSTGKFFQIFDGIRAANRMGGVLLWFASMTVAIAGFLAVQHFLVAGTLADDVFMGGAIWTMILLTAPLAAIYIGIIKRVVQGVRMRQFHATWEPRLRQFMQEQTPGLMHHFGADERARVRLEKRLEHQRSKT